MRTLTTIIGTIAGFVPAAAFAATTATVENTGLMGWIFLGFGALVIIGQAIPAVLMMIGFAKGLTGKETEKHTA
ncbi:hypothetical protein [Geobacter sp. AOG2]|uniref:hypothetical protein n=1 Tax=Geobacter sp. AOG2 TaxID=1566347 RepID=UPI001CC4A051|nr:hypothetical protein [Geobacter sp. AOG2]GFE62802.1 hypothetical protein AOG2_33900 [Geobacter sp. AOG2]